VAYPPKWRPERTERHADRLTADASHARANASQGRLAAGVRGHVHLMTRLAALMSLIALVAVVLALTVESLRFLFVVGVAAAIVAVVAGFRGRNRPDIAVGDSFDGPL
jgi:hypothetical protein